MLEFVKQSFRIISQRLAVLRDPPPQYPQFDAGSGDRLTDGDVVVPRGSQEDLEVADMYLIQG